MASDSNSTTSSADAASIGAAVSESQLRLSYAAALATAIEHAIAEVSTKADQAGFAAMIDLDIAHFHTLQGLQQRQFEAMERLLEVAAAFEPRAEREAVHG
jgi:hypothetical protein